MKRIAFVAMMGLLLLGLASTTLRAADAKAPQTKTGTVKKVDVAAKQVVVMVTREMTFTVNAETKIQQGDAPKKLNDIKVDNKVSVEYVRDGDARTAKKIVILGDK
jgi:hypothetical protein